jgi:hypothetical protein
MDDLQEQRSQRFASIADEVLANIAEYAVLTGIGFNAAMLKAKNNYAQMVASIHVMRSCSNETL